MSDLASPQECLKAYEDGLPGWQFNMRENVEFLSTQKYQYFSEPNIRGSGLGKRALLWQYAKKLDDKCFTEAQTTGDCFVAGTLVRMGDGTEKPIELIETGDVVASPFGGIRNVTDTFSKPYHGTVCTLRGERCADSVTATADHRFVSYGDGEEWDWVAAGSLAAGDRILVPFGEVGGEEYHTYDLCNEELCGEDLNALPCNRKQRLRRRPTPPGFARALNGKNLCRRNIALNEDVAWLIGIWLAEGSTDKSKTGLPHGLTWNLCSDELSIARRIRHILSREFAVSARIYTIPSKPSCLFVGASCAPLARWMYRICGRSNTYGKQVPVEVMSSPRGVRLWCLRGWLEGDGCASAKPRPGHPDWLAIKVSGVSVCRRLARDMKYLATSCGILCGDRVRKAYKRSKESCELFFYGDGAVAVMPGKLARCREKTRGASTKTVRYGFAQRIKENVRSHFSGNVYCIEVEGDHAFIANGYAVHNCVSHGSRNARDITRAVEILVKREPEDWFKMGATEPTYGARGHSGQGMSPARASRFERDTGFLARHNYEGVVDLSKYKSSIGTAWGSSGVPENVKELCRKNKVGVISQVRTQEELMDAMFNGYAAHSGQYASWSTGSNSKGVHGRTPGGWNHDMCICGYDDSKEFFPFRVWMIVNSWGPWNQKPSGWPREYGPWIPGMILTTAEDFHVCVEAGDCWVYGSIDGYPPQRLPDYGTIGLLRHD